MYIACCNIKKPFSRTMFYPCNKNHYLSIQIKSSIFVLFGYKLTRHVLHHHKPSANVSVWSSPPLYLRIP